MGCYLGTCSLTNLPIYMGQRIVVHFLVESGSRDYAFTPNDVWDSFGLPIRGEYDDYGFVHKLDKNALKRHSLNARLISNDLQPHEGENYNICKPVTPENIMNLKDFNTMIHRRNLALKRYYKPERGPLLIQYCMFHESAYDSMVNSLPDSEKISKGRVESFLKFLLKPTTDLLKSVVLLELRGHDWLKKEFGSADYNPKNPRDFYLPQIFNTVGRYSIFRKWPQYVDQGIFTKKDIPEIAAGLTEGLNFDRVLMNCRRLYLPLSCTSQESLHPLEYDYHKVYGQTLKMISDHEHEWDEDEEEIEHDPNEKGS